MRPLHLITFMLLTLVSNLGRAEPRWIVPATPGATDSVARIVTTALSARGERIEIENKPGGGGVIGLNAVAHASDDAYAFVSASMVTLAPHLTGALSDVVSQLDPIAYVGDTGIFLVARSDSPQTNLRALLAHARTIATPYGHFGPGTLAHVLGSLIAKQENVKLTPVAYKGSVAIIQDILGGHLPVGFVGIDTAMPFIKEGKLRVLAASGLSADQRTAFSVASYGEQGYPGYDALGGGFMVLARKGMAVEQKRRMRELVHGVVQEPEVVRRLAAGGVFPRQDSATLDALFPAWQARWKGYLEVSGVWSLRQ